MAKQTIKKVGRPYIKRPTKAQKIKSEYNRRYREKKKLEKQTGEKTTHKYTKTERIPYSPFRLTKEMREAIKLGDIDKLMGMLMNAKSIIRTIMDLATDGDIEKLKKILFEKGDAVSMEDYLKQIVYAYRSKVQQQAEKIDKNKKKKDLTNQEKRILKKLQGVNDKMLQEIFDKLPNETKETIKSQLGTDEIQGFSWDKGLKGFTNGYQVIYIKSNSDGIYRENTMTVSYLKDIKLEKGEVGV